MKTLLSILTAITITAGSLGAQQQTNSVLLQMQMLDPSTLKPLGSTNFGTMPPNDFATNYSIELRSSTDCTIPVSLWPVFVIYPATQFTNQGPPGAIWTNRVLIDGAIRFMVMRSTNINNGGVGPFSAPAVWVPTQAGQVGIKN